MPRYRYSIFRVFRSIDCRSATEFQRGWMKEDKVGTPDQKRQQPLFLRLVASGAPFGNGSHYRSMDGWVGKRKRARPASVPLRPAIPLSLFLLSRVPSPPFSPSSFNPISLSHSSVKISPAFFLSPASVTCSSSPLGFRYLIKSSYDEKEEDPREREIRRGSSISLGYQSDHAFSRKKNWGMIMRGRRKPRWKGMRFSRVRIKILTQQHGLLIHLSDYASVL